MVQDNIENQFKKQLSKNWKIQNETEIEKTGEEISTADFNSTKWFQTIVPSTVMGTLVGNGVIKDPFFGDNLKKIDTNQFKNPWWYRTEFELSADEAEHHVILDFDGINYRADIWLNGKKIAGGDVVFGAFRRFSFDISEAVQAGKNILAVKVFPPIPGNFSIGFVDWNPTPPDLNMGIFRPVTLRFHKGMAIENPFVQTNVNLKSLKEAALTVSAEVVNYTENQIMGTLIGEIESIKINQQVTIAPNSRQLVIFKPDNFSELNIKNPRLWWPIHIGEPELYNLELQFQIGESISDTMQQRFGIREVEDYLLNDIHRGFKINGKKVLIKGGGWTDDIFLMDTEKSLEAQVKYVKHMNLNCIRLEGIWGKDHKLYDLCDENGILLMVGWSCHWEHANHMGVEVNERFGAVNQTEDIQHISKAWQDQVIWLRNHPSIFVWAVASDKVPKTELEKKYIEIFNKYDSTRPYLNSTGGVGSEQHIIGEEDIVSDISGSSGVKMLGPYAYTPPIYWFTDTKLGGAYGFNTETGPGAQVPPLESIKKMIPKEHLFPPNEMWDYHCALHEFATLSRYKKALNERYGVPKNLEEFEKKAQVLNYELMRPMFEAFQAHKKRATGVIQWMLNAAWPKMYWQLYDHYLTPNGAFYAAKKACSPLHVLFHYGDRKVYLINDYFHNIDNLQVSIRVYDVNSNELFNQTLHISADADSSIPIVKIPELENLTTSYFLDLRLYENHGKEISNNFYWLSTKDDVLDYEANAGEWAFYTPSKGFADFNLINSLPEVNLNIKHQFKRFEAQQQVLIEIENPTDKIAFFIDLKVKSKKTGELILPVFWEDNYISLLPGELRKISATFKSADEAELFISGWNVI
jgi:exo-1,4-beta-D-glucosaminidase